MSVSVLGFLGGLDSKEATCNGAHPGLILGEGKGTPPAFLPGEFHGQGSPAGYSPRGCKELDTAEWLTHLSFLRFQTVVCFFECTSSPCFPSSYLFLSADPPSFSSPKI